LFSKALLSSSSLGPDATVTFDFSVPALADFVVSSTLLPKTEILKKKMASANGSFRKRLINTPK